MKHFTHPAESYAILSRPEYIGEEVLRKTLLPHKGEQYIILKTEPCTYIKEGRKCAVGEDCPGRVMFEGEYRWSISPRCWGWGAGPVFDFYMVE